MIGWTAVWLAKSREPRYQCEPVCPETYESQWDKGTLTLQIKDGRTIVDRRMQHEATDSIAPVGEDVHVEERGETRMVQAPRNMHKAAALLAPRRKAAESQGQQTRAKSSSKGSTHLTTMALLLPSMRGSGPFFPLVGHHAGEDK
mmetsp:Transcript_30125/g.74827  ORF Transcript_30125/g.74827 Transcript_30125/m.74827 type:complete len:145 (-) Transcript_30125:481-915(-)